VLSEKGLYDISFDENKYPSSFELYLWDYTSPFVFVYPYCDASDKLTFAHEFGHFAADYVCYGSYAGTDISEIHSQAFEYLSLCYTKNMGELTQLKMLDSLRVYVECAAYTQFEHQLYQMTAEELTVDNILALYDQIGQQFGFGSGCDPRELITISHFYTDPLYNISYVLSNDLALQFYQKEQLYEGSGLKLYEQCLTDQGSDILVFVETYHLDSPFTEGRLEAIAETFRDILIP
jgi:oligoendopeptidase F